MIVPCTVYSCWPHAFITLTCCRYLMLVGMISVCGQLVLSVGVVSGFTGLPHNEVSYSSCLCAYFLVASSLLFVLIFVIVFINFIFYYCTFTF